MTLTPDEVATAAAAPPPAPRPPPPPPDPEVSALDTIRPLRATLKGLATVVAPTSLVTSLLYYFGWARTSTQAQVLGLHDSLLGYSSQDYLLRSVDPMFWPMFVGMIVVLVGIGGHRTMLEWIIAGQRSGEPGSTPARRRLLQRCVAAVAATSLAGLVLGLLGASVDRPSRFVSIVSPLAVTIGIAAAGYAFHLGRLLRAPGPGDGASELHALRKAASTVLMALLLLSLFWSVARYAEVKGIDLALQVERSLPQLPNVVVYSARQLHLEHLVKEEQLAGDDSAYRYRYSGLKLLFRSGGRFFLRPDEPSSGAVNIVLPESDEMRLEFEGAF